MISEVWRLTYLVLICAGAIPALLFPILYTIRVRWWKYEMSTHIFAYSFLFATLYLNQFFNALFHPPMVVRLWIGLGMSVLAVFVAWHRLLLFIKARKIRDLK